MLAWTIYLTFLGMAALAFAPRDNPRVARGIALATALAGLALGLAGVAFAADGQFHALADCAWIDALGARYLIGADGISLVLVLLTGIAAVAGVLFSWNIEHRSREFFALYLALVGGVYGVFLSFDLFLLFVFYELAIIPKYFLIAIWGSTRREYGAMKLALYSFLGSGMVLIGLIAAFVAAGAKSTSLFALAEHPFPQSIQLWAFPLTFIGFAILAGLWPFHTWAPTGHVAAPTAASMLLAGVVMKLGAYGCLRVAMTVFPHGLDPWGCSVLGFGSWRDVFGLLSVIGIVHGACVALVQSDFKFVIGYSSVSHMGFVLMGLVTVQALGLSGAVLQMFSHGIIAGLLFAVVGRMVYERTHTRDLGKLEPMGLARTLPFAAVTFIVAGIASMGLPGFSGFVAELHVLLGAWQAFPVLALGAGVGIVIGVAFILRAIQRAFFGGQETGAEPGAPLALAAAQATPHLDGGPITIPERLGAALLIGTSLAVGLCPRPLLALIDSALAAPLFRELLGGAR